MFGAVKVETALNRLSRIRRNLKRGFYALGIFVFLAFVIRESHLNEQLVEFIRRFEAGVVSAFLLGWVWLEAVLLKCPDCRASVQPLRKYSEEERTLSRDPYACRNCGLVLEPHLKPALLVNSDLPLVLQIKYSVRPGFIMGIALFGVAIVGASLLFEEDPKGWFLGAFLFVLASLSYWFSTRSLSGKCPCCQRSTRIGKYCEACGIKWEQPPRLKKAELESELRDFS